MGKRGLASSIKWTHRAGSKYLSFARDQQDKEMVIYGLYGWPRALQEGCHSSENLTIRLTAQLGPGPEDVGPLSMIQFPHYSGQEAVALVDQGQHLLRDSPFWILSSQQLRQAT